MVFITQTRAAYAVELHRLPNLNQLHQPLVAGMLAAFITQIKAALADKGNINESKDRSKSR